MTNFAATMRTFRPAPHVLAFFDGRIEGKRLHSAQPNWLDDGGYSLGTCSYAILDGADALVYDTHMSLAHARRIREAVEAEGAKNIRIVLSHHHLDHIAGNAVFEDCEILANAATDAAMRDNIEEAMNADPPVSPVIMPNHVFESELDVVVGSVKVALRSFDIHSHDGLVMWLPDTGLLFAGDTLEDTVTYVAEPARLDQHLRDLDRMAKMEIDRILPNHGAPEIIESGGYGPELIGATQTYIRALLRCRADPALAELSLADFVKAETSAGVIQYAPAYEPVHRNNVGAVLGT